MLLFISSFYLYCNIITVFRIPATEASEEPHCKFKVKINNCDQEYNKRINMYDSQEEIILQYCPNTSKTIKSIDWTLRDSNKNVKTIFLEAKDKKILPVSAHSIEKGKYYLTAEAKLKSGAFASDECELNYLGEPPVIKFLEGPIQVIPYNTTFYHTIDRTALKSYKDDKIAFAIKCQGDCKCLYEEYPEKYYLTGILRDCWTWFETTAAMKYGTAKVRGVTVAYVEDHLPVYVDIRCDSNCDYRDGIDTLEDYPVKLSLKCTKNCDEFKSDKTTWDIGQFIKNIILKNTSDYTVTNDNTVATIHANVLKASVGYYEVRVEYTGLYKTFYVLYPKPKLESPSCVISPVEGISLETYFQFNCTHDSFFDVHPLEFAVYQTHRGIDTFVTKSTIPKFSTLLKSYPEVKQKIKLTATYDTIRYTIVTNEISINVGEEDVGRLEDMTKKMIAEFGKRDITKAKQIAEEIIQMVEKVSVMMPLDLKNAIYGKTIETLNQILKHDPDSFVSIVNQLPTIYNTNNLSKNSIAALSELCETLSVVELDKTTSKKLKKSETEKYTQYIEECASKLLKLEKMQRNKTGHVYVDEPVVTEDYGNYDANLKLDDLEKNQINAVSTRSTAAQSVGAVLNLTEQYNFTDDFSTTLVAKDTKDDMPKKEYSAEGIVLKPINIKSNQTEIAVVFTSYKNEALESGPSFMSTNIADIGFFAEGNFKNKVTNAKFSLTFDILKEVHEWKDFVVTVPNNYMNWVVPDINYDINVHRINLISNYYCLAEFSGLKEGIKLLVGLTVNRRPNLQDVLKNGYTIIYNDNKTHLLHFPFPRTLYDKFLYAGVLPHPEMLANNSEILNVYYKIKFSQPVCLFYDRNYLGWTPADCEVKIELREGKRKIVCSCEHSSIFSAKIDTPPNKLDPVFRFSVVTVQSPNYIIFIHVCVVFLCFCIALMFSRSRSKAIWGRDKVFFLSDNLKNDRYAYLIVVKTGSLPYSGTTSNIMLRIKGNVNSRPHVLNYPDPNKSFLNKNNTDWFVLTNDVYLGTIHSIELWLDNIGLRPPWYCEYVSIIDMQMKKEYYFNVERWFTVAIEDGDFAEIERTRKSEKFDFVKRLTKSMKFYYGPDHTWNIFERNQDQKISFPQRLTIILSIILTTYVVTILFLGPPTLVSYDVYSYGEFRFYSWTIPVIFGISLISSLVNLPFVFVFRNSVMTKIEHSYMHQEKMFSLRKMIAVWVLLCIWITICMIYLLIIGFFVTLYTTYMWMLCSVCAIICSIFLVENVYLTVIKMFSKFFKKVNRKFYDVKGILTEVEFQRRALFQRFGETLFRPYFQSHYFRLTRTKILNIRERQKVRLEVIDLFGDMCLYVALLALLYIRVAFNDNSDYYLTSDNMVRILNGTLKNNYYPLEDISNMNDVYEYLNKTIIPVTQPINWYGEWYMEDPGIMIDFKTKIIGVVQLRQQRHNSTTEYKRRFSYNDGKYISSSLGEIGSYGGEGYVINLGRNKDNSIFVLNQLVSHNWIDNETFVVFIEFWTYNAFSNMFCSVRIVIEKNPTGDMGRFIHAFPRELLFLNFEKSIAYVVSGLFATAVVVMAAKRFIDIITKKQEFFKNIWNWADLIIIILSFIITGLAIAKNVMISRLLDDWAKLNHNEFVNYFRLFSIWRLIELLVAFLVCIATIRIWKYFKFGRAFYIFGRCLQISAKDLLIIIFYHVFVFVMFSLYLFTMHGAQFNEFRSFGTTITTIAISTKNFFKGLNKKDFALASDLIYLYWAMFMITSVTFYSFYCSTLIMAFQSCKIYFSNKSRHFTLKDYLTDEWNYKKNLVKRQQLINLRLKAGVDTMPIKKFVTPKAAAQRYADCIFLSDRKLSLMKVIAKLLFRNRGKPKSKKMEEEDFVEMARYIILLAQKDSKHSNHNAYFKGWEGNKIAFVSDVRIRQAAFITEKLLIHEETEHLYNNPLVHISGDELRLNFIRDNLLILIDVINNIKVPEF